MNHDLNHYIINTTRTTFKITNIRTSVTAAEQTFYTNAASCGVFLVNNLNFVNIKHDGLHWT